MFSPTLLFVSLFWNDLSHTPKAGKAGILSLPAGCPPSNAKKENKFLLFILNFGLLIHEANGVFGLPIPYSKEIFRICQLRSWPPHYASSSTTIDFSNFKVPLNVFFLLWKTTCNGIKTLTKRHA